MNAWSQLRSGLDHLNVSTGQGMIITAGIIAGLVLLRWILKRIKYPGTDNAITLAVMFVVMFVTVDGALRLAFGPLRAHGLEALFPAILFESVGIKIYRKAQAYAAIHGRPGRYGRWLWGIGVLAGALVAGAAYPSMVAMAYRFAIPLVGIGLVWLDLTPDGALKEKGSVTWRWGWRQALVLAGAITPDERDVERVHRDVLVAKMARLRVRIALGQPKDRRVKRSLRRLERQALRVPNGTDGDAVLASVRETVERVLTIVVLTGPGGTGTDSVPATGELPVPVETSTSTDEAVPVARGPRAASRAHPTGTGDTVPESGDPDRPADGRDRLDAELEDMLAPSAGRARDDMAAVEVLRALPRDVRGCVTLRSARTALDCGSDRARRLLKLAGLWGGELEPVNGHAG